MGKAFSKDTIAKRTKALEKATTPKERFNAVNIGIPKFKSSKDINQSFNWNNQACDILDLENERFKILRILKQRIKFRFHREFPENYKLNNLTISKDVTGYYVSFSIEYYKLINLGMSIVNIDISKCIGIDLNAYNFAVSSDVSFIETAGISKVKNNHLINNGSTNRKGLLYSKDIKVLHRKQSRRVLKERNNSRANSSKFCLGKNFKKAQKKINKLSKKIQNKKSDLYHKISTKLTNKFEMIVVEDLKLKNIINKVQIHKIIRITT